MVASAPPADQFMSTVPSNVIGLRPQQVSEQAAHTVPSNPLMLAVHPTQNPPAKRSRTGATKMRPSKTSITPR